MVNFSHAHEESIKRKKEISTPPTRTLRSSFSHMLYIHVFDMWLSSGKITLTMGCFSPPRRSRIATFALVISLLKYKTQTHAVQFCEPSSIKSCNRNFISLSIPIPLLSYIFLVYVSHLKT